ncbi:succinate dehydrogenase, cytochrome b556 subunit [Nitrosomonas sp. JL21]|uniref:succinate dehydrogenase, cytochrome b556 subunit n=1 Tax=Nitrosomonas sp. JL21 TaxID=153949 RepID=UPI001369B1D6|nr:succinate dehydrogenase, cytochrome b556 subunit [Nitrosomonas sp. JL21]MBL8497855.1 succinate dehydrogenase, cytochrome b556 subunit [Nitrosomonas sp.]MXS76802.1 succinate dehydrogenase, cytochrome b556 subunit [Nitrosomonas sp. JL21]
METKLHNQRPKHLNLFKIKQPLPAVVSILHRISGVLLFFPGIPLLLYSLQMALQSQQSFEALQTCLSEPMIKVMLLISLWFFLHHVCAGIRHVLLDLQIGIALPQARLGSRLVLIGGVMLTLLAAAVIW